MIILKVQFNILGCYILKVQFYIFYLLTCLYFFLTCHVFCLHFEKVSKNTYILYYFPFLQFEDDEIPDTAASESVGPSPGLRKRLFAKELRCMMYGFGDDQNPYTESVDMLEDIVIEFITQMVSVYDRDVATDILLSTGITHFFQYRNLLEN